MFNVVVYTVVTFLAVATLYPFPNVLAISFNDSTDTVRGGITIFPREFTWANYQAIFAFGSLLTGFKIVVTVPILVVYPFLQKYFVKGMTLGAVKS